MTHGLSIFVINMKLDEVVEIESFYDFGPDRSFESWVNERRDNMMSSSVVSLIDDRSEILSEVYIISLSYIEIMTDVFRPTYI